MQAARADARNLATSTTAQQVVQTRSQRISLAIRNHGANTIYLGTSSGVTAANGYPLLAGEETEYTDYLGEVWAIGAAASDLRYWENY